MDEKTEVIEMTADIVSAYVGNNSVAASDLPGLIQSVHRALAREIADNTAPVSIAITRQLIWRMAGAAHPMEAHRADSRGIQARGRSGDAREGVSSFLEKRAANYPDRVSHDLPDIWPQWDAPSFR